MFIKVETLNEVESNRFLRALWAELRRLFTKQSWLFTPTRNDKLRQISLGQLDLGLADGPIHVSVLYKSRGGMIGVLFERHFGKPVESDAALAGTLQESVHLALTNASQPCRMLVGAPIQSSVSQLSGYRGNDFIVEPSDNNRCIFSLEVSTFDLVDARAEFKRKLNDILDVLATETNVPFWQTVEAELATESRAELSEIFVTDPDWIDHAPQQNGRLVLSLEGKHFIDLVAKTQVLIEEHRLFLQACRHFHTALKLNTESFDIFSLNERQDTITVLNISALEVASIIGAPKSVPCSECGQPIYRIKKRVADYVSRSLPDHLVKFIKSLYDHRSKYLHTGTLLSHRDYVGISLPQIDMDSATGCKHSLFPSSVINLKEYTGYCLRQTLKSII